MREPTCGLRVIDDLMAYFDEDGGGDIDFHEFSALMERCPCELALARLAGLAGTKRDLERERRPGGCPLGTLWEGTG